MAVDSSQETKASGLNTLVDTIISPKEAFEALAVSPTWGWACLVAIVLLLGGYALQRPAQLHAAVGTLQHMMATNSLFASMSDEQKQRAIESASHPSALQTAFGVFGVIVSLFFAALINSVVLLIANIAGRGRADFGRLWAASMNIAIPTFGLNYVVLGVICLAVGADHFQNTGDLLRSVPGLATLLPGTRGALAGFLMGINVFTLWGFGLNVAMMRIMARVSGAVAWIFPLLILLGGACIFAGTSRFYGG
ncbi:MAG TPA: hypothetical protein VGG89_14575 [Candidatus Baltobacteraceae bacterium]|jgi:hypothetical protein